VLEIASGVIVMLAALNVINTVALLVAVFHIGRSIVALRETCDKLTQFLLIRLRK
jgi:hypothetical protein